MFYYYGRKHKIARHYPEARFPVLVEPFAGSAAYALFGNHWRKKVILIERDPQVAALWRWFIDQATEKDLLEFPDPEIGKRTEEFLHILHAASKRAFDFRGMTATSLLMANWRANKPRMVSCLSKIKHWTLIEGDYTCAPDVEATWFIDPPYQGEAGTGYRYGSKQLDYQQLARWVAERKGEVIVCEGGGANWLPFEPLVDLVGVAGKRSKEQMYHRSPHKPIPIWEILAGNSDDPK